MKKIVIFTLCLLLAGCSSKMELKKHTFTYELGSDVFANPNLYVKDADRYDLTNVKIVPQSKGLSKVENHFVNEKKDYLVCGTYSFLLVDGRNKIPFNIKIKDTKAPNVAASPSEIHVSKGEVPDFQSAFQASDLSGVNYDATWDTTITGSYDITVRIYDRFGNAQVKNVTLVVE